MWNKLIIKIDEFLYDIITAIIIFFRYNIFYCYNDSEITWFRLFGFGLSWKDKRKSKLYFSERNKINCWHTKNYVFKYLSRKHWH
jgi:hypothetical protein